MSVQTRESADNADVWQIFNKLLRDFGIETSTTGSHVIFEGFTPDVNATKSNKLLLSLIGALPAAANALVAAQIFEQRGGSSQTIKIDLRKGHNYIDPNIGMTPSINGQEITIDLVAGNPFLRNIYETKDGRHVVPSAVYVDLVYRWTAFLSCSVNASDVETVFKSWNSAELEDVCAEVGMPLAVIRSEEEWLSTPQGKALSQKHIVPVEKVTEAPPKTLYRNPRRPLEGLKVLCLTHAIAGPSSGRTLAEHGAAVLQIMYTHGFEHSFVYTYANLGCASSRLNLNKEQDRDHLWTLVREADVWIDSYRDTALSKFGYTDEQLHTSNPSLIISHVRAYGTDGPWASRPGFDMQGSAVSGMMTLCGDGIAKPAWPPGMVINDYTTGYYGALAIQVAVLRRLREGGGYILSPSLAGTAMSIVKYFKTSDYPNIARSVEKPLPPDVLEGHTNVGYIRTLMPLPVMSGTPIEYSPILLDPIGSNLPVYPGLGPEYDPKAVCPLEGGLFADGDRSSYHFEQLKKAGLTQRR